MTIEQDPNGWRVTRKTGDEKFKPYGRYATLGDVVAIIRTAHRAHPSRWKVDGVEVPGTATAGEIVERLSLA